MPERQLPLDLPPTEDELKLTRKTCRWCCQVIQGRPVQTRLYDYCSSACADDHTLYLLRSGGA